MAGLEAETRKLAAEGLGLREMAARLESDHGLKVSYTTVRRFLEEEADEKRTAARAVAAQDAKESVPLVTGALKQIVVMNLRAATIAFIGEERGGTKESPKPDIPDLANASRAATGAAKALHAVTMGDSPDDAMSELRKRVTSIVAEKNKREREERAAAAQQSMLN